MAVRSLRYNTFEGRSWKGATFATDADALAFLEAAQVYDRNQQKAIVDLVRRLKTAGLWSKMTAIYPFIGGTASSHKWNLKDPRDVDAAYRLTFNGGWTHSANGALPNGSNAWANTQLSNNVNGLNDMHLAMYSRTNNGSRNNVDMGCANPADPSSSLHYDGFGLGCLARINSTFQGPLYTPTFTTRLMITTSTEANKSLIYHDGIFRATNTTTSGSAGVRYIYLGARNDTSPNVVNGTPQYYSDKQFAFASVGAGLTADNVTAYTNIVDAYQKRLGRNV